MITPISRDHVEFLGDTLEAIAAEKAGILKRGAPAVFAEQDDVVQATLEREAARLGVHAPLSGARITCAGARPTGLIYEDQSGVLDLPSPKLFGAHQTGNAGVAIAALRAVFPGIVSSNPSSEGWLRRTGPRVCKIFAAGDSRRLAPERRGALARRWSQRSRRQGAGESDGGTRRDHAAAARACLQFAQIEGPRGFFETIRRHGDASDRRPDPRRPGVMATGRNRGHCRKIWG